MNQTQRKHVISRLATLRSTRTSEYEKKLSDEYEKKRQGPLTVGKLLAGISDGTIKKQKHVKLSEVIDWHLNEITDVFDIELDNDELPEEMFIRVEKFEEKLKAETDRIEDELILGDAENALEAIANFSEFAAKQK